MTFKHLTLYFLLLPCHWLWAGSASDKPLFPVIINGHQLQSLLGHDIETIRVYAFHQGKAVQIPFQIDQKDAENNWVWHAPGNAQNTSELHSMNTYDNQDPEGKRIFDENDQLVFMALDLGEKEQKVLSKIKAAQVLELSVSDDQSPKPNGWIYITYNLTSPPPLSDRRYMSYLQEHGQIISPVYSLAYSSKHLATIDTINIGNQTIINKTRIRGTVNVRLLLFNTTIDFNETEVKGHSVGFINGPIRTIRHFVTYINIAPGINSRLQNIDHIFYPHHTEVPLPVIKDLLVKNMALKVDAHYPDTHSCSKQQQDLQVIDNASDSESGMHATAEKNTPMLSLQCPTYSIFTMLAIPDELAGSLYSSAYISETSKTTASASEAEPVAGFYLATGNSFPKGQYQMKVISVFADTPDRHKSRQDIARITNTRLSFTTVQKSIQTNSNHESLQVSKLLTEE